MNPDNSEHRQYLDQLCEDFETKLVDLIQRAAMKASREEHSEAFYREAMQHSAFRMAKCKSFTGRESVLDVSIHEFEILIGFDQTNMITRDKLKRFFFFHLLLIMVCIYAIDMQKF